MIPAVLEDDKASSPLIYGRQADGQDDFRDPHGLESIIIHRQAILNSLHVVSGSVWAPLCFLPGALLRLPGPYHHP